MWLLALLNKFPGATAVCGISPPAQSCREPGHRDEGACMLVNVCTCVRFSVCVCVLRCGDKCQQQQQQQQQPEASAEALTDTPLHTRYSLFACGVQMVKKSIVEKLVRMLDRHNFEFLVLMVTFLKRLSIFRENKDKVLCVCVFVFVCLCVCFCVFVCAFLCVCVCVFVFVCAFFLCVHVCVHVCAYVCVHTCVYGQVHASEHLLS